MNETVLDLLTTMMAEALTKLEVPADEIAKFLNDYKKRIEPKLLTSNLPSHDDLDFDYFQIVYNLIHLWKKIELPLTFQNLSRSDLFFVLKNCLFTSHVLMSLNTVTNKIKVKPMSRKRFDKLFLAGEEEVVRQLNCPSEADTKDCVAETIKANHFFDQMLPITVERKDYLFTHFLKHLATIYAFYRIKELESEDIIHDPIKVLSETFQHGIHVGLLFDEGQVLRGEDLVEKGALDGNRKNGIREG